MINFVNSSFELIELLALFGLIILISFWLLIWDCILVICCFNTEISLDKLLFLFFSSANSDFNFIIDDSNSFILLSLLGWLFGND